MNVVGKVGSLISQGVYSVATPFHPFGGAVDIIVVQQQDGTFRSTPWYVRFGKFQGVLKGAEKVVRIEVNGVGSNFHMYLDNSGEAYFIREAEPRKDSELNLDSKDSDSIAGVREDTSVDYNDNKDIRKENDNIHRRNSTDSGISEVQVEDGRESLIMCRLERTESESERRFYEFQDEQSSLEGSVDLSEYGSSRYDNLDSVEQMIELQDNSEMVLVSVDGHILTAPISSSDDNSENVQLSIPQFHLGPAEGTSFVEDDEEYNTGEAAWVADYPSGSEGCKPDTFPELVKSDGNASEHQREVGEGDEEHACQVQGTPSTLNQEEGVGMGSDLIDAFTLLKKKDVFRSCLELSTLATQFGNVNEQEIGSTLDSHEGKEGSQENYQQTENGRVMELRNPEGLTLSESDIPTSMITSDLQVEVESLEKNALESNTNASDGMPVRSISNDEKPEEQIGVAVAARRSESGPQGPTPEDTSSKMDFVEPQRTSSSKDMKTDNSRRFDLSLCRNLLTTGMGLAAAAEVFNEHCISKDQFSVSAASIIKNENLVVRIQEKYLSWDKAAAIVLGMAAYGLYLPVEPSEAIPVEQDEEKTKEDDSAMMPPSGRRWRLWPIPFRRIKTLEHTTSNLSAEEVFVDSESSFQNQPGESTPTPRSSSESPQKHFIRTNVPTTEQIASLNLREGQNMVTFSFSTRVLGMQKVDAHIYLWKWNARIVISDVDGTITKSDVLGQFMPLVGRDWTQSGVAGLFSAIKENGYQLLFLSARAIVQAYLTRSFLLNLKQDGKALPSGPVVISPDGLFPSLYREVIRRAPHEFKIACLEDIKALFPSDYNPFYAGFGNRDTDELSYRKIGIPKGKIFIINPKGEVAISQHRIGVKSYTSLHTLVNDMFPPTSLVEQEDYNPWNYWKMPLPDIDNL